MEREMLIRAARWKPVSWAGLTCSLQATVLEQPLGEVRRPFPLLPVQGASMEVKIP